MSLITVQKGDDGMTVFTSVVFALWDFKLLRAGTQKDS